jgi:hypothetical protein
MLLSLVALVAWQPDAAMLGQLYREAFDVKAVWRLRHRQFSGRDGLGLF